MSSCRLVFDHAEQGIEGLGEFLDPVLLQRAGHVGEVHAARREPVHDGGGLAPVLGQRGPDRARDPRRAEGSPAAEC